MTIYDVNNCNRRKKLASKITPTPHRRVERVSLQNDKQSEYKQRINRSLYTINAADIESCENSIDIRMSRTDKLGNSGTG